jgi:hypothetical protein
LYERLGFGTARTHVAWSRTLPSLR